jgi:predicted  nucleic acid-binding Zn-ribbon protein
MTKQELEEKLEQTEKALADYQFNYPSIKELEQENAALKNEIVNLKGVIESLSEQRDGFEKECGKLEGKVQDWTSEYYELENFMNNKVAEAKEIIKGLLSLKSTVSSAQDIKNRFSVREKAEEFLGKEE